MAIDHQLANVLLLPRSTDFDFELSYFRAAICRNHPKIVPGFTIWQHFFRSSGLKVLPTTARRRR
jgi:hypothetical protein